MMGWSMRWAVTSAVLLVISAVVVLAQWLQYPGRLPTWVVAVMVAASLAAGAFAAEVQRLRMAPYAAIVAGLTSRQRAELAAVIKPGPLRADPAVLAAAAWLRRRGQAQRVPRWRSWVVVGVMVAYGAWATTVPGAATVGVILLARTVDLVQESSPRPDPLSPGQVDLFARQVRQLLDAEQPLATACR